MKTKPMVDRVESKGSVKISFCYKKRFALVLVFISFVFSIADGQLTQHLLDSNKAVEANPLLAYLMQDFGYALSSIKIVFGLVLYTILGILVTFLNRCKTIELTAETLMIVTAIQFGVCIYQIMLINLGT